MNPTSPTSPTSPTGASGTPGAPDAPTSSGPDASARGIDWNFPFEEPLHEVFPALHVAHNAWMAAIDSLHAPDRKTHELIRMVVTVMLRNPAGVRRHAQLAHEVGATWEEILGAIMLTTPGGGVLTAVEAIPPAREGFEAARDADRD